MRKIQKENFLKIILKKSEHEVLGLLRIQENFEKSKEIFKGSKKSRKNINKIFFEWKI